MEIKKEYSAALGFPYIAYIPERISDKPSIIFQLHGAGERGNGDNLDDVNKYGLVNCADDDTLEDMILILPQCPAESFWVAHIESLKLFFDRCIQKYNADDKRIFLCGLSMGGFGTWYMAMAYPDMFRAIAPCCGGGMPWNAATLKMPVWAFHGKEDDVVNPHETYDMVEALLKSGADVKYTYFDNVGHESWNLAFNRDLVYWFKNC